MSNRGRGRGSIGGRASGRGRVFESALGAQANALGAPLRLALTATAAPRVRRYDEDEITVLFDEHGYRQLFVPVVLGRGLLRPADRAS
jgi:hypothetical protein